MLDKQAWLIGRGKADMTPKVQEIAMLGYGNPDNYVTGVETPINTRVIWLKHPDDLGQLIFINMEICFPTTSIRRGLLHKIEKERPEWGVKPADFILSTQHTHSAPSGYTHYALYSMPTPGFCQEVLDTYIDAVFEAMEIARSTLTSGKVLIKEGEFHPDIPVSYNRSMKAYNRNKEIHKHYKIEEQNICVNREMKFMDCRVDDAPFASMNWFAVHCTSILWRNKLISPDNKGYASLYLEEFMKEQGDSNYVAAFCQGDAGDVSPLYQVPYLRRFMPKKSNDEFQEARTNGKHQYEKAREIMHKNGRHLEGDVDNEILYVDMGNTLCDPEYLPEYLREKKVYTSPPCLGVAFLMGAENAGIDYPLALFAIGVSKVIRLFEVLVTAVINSNEAVKVRTKYKAQNPKAIFVESGAKKVWGTDHILGLILPSWVDKTISIFKKLYRKGGLKEHTWTPQIVPIQLSVVGKHAFLSLPAETSTMAGRRIRSTTKKILKFRGVEEVILVPYSNDYCGYITTPEEYTAQCYEGGHTVYGRWTLPAFQTHIKTLALEMNKGHDDRDFDREMQPPVFSQEELKIRKFVPHGY